jgi:hypothetical protein
MISEDDSSRPTRIEQFRERLAEFRSYLTANQTRLINSGREYREGHRISTARVESTVDQLVDWRMEKKQHGRERGQSTILDRFGARPTRLAWPLGWKSLGRDRRTDGQSRWRGNQTHAPPRRTKNGETCCEGYQLLCREVQPTA